ncbi:MAG TPA: protein kinase, partial [Nannocystaceae bacterium]|nr:protein kinase [Nannocystaceae bacterium]
MAELDPSLCETDIPDTGELDPLLRGIAAAPSIPLPMSELQPGERIDRMFEVVGVLGAGGMGVVYEAKDLSLDRRVAIKLHLRGRSESAVSPMLREAQTMARVRHPNVITVHAVGTHESALYIAMEYIGGGTLRAWLAARSRTVSEILDVFEAAAQG